MEIKNGIALAFVRPISIICFWLTICCGVPFVQNDFFLTRATIAADTSNPFAVGKSTVTPINLEREKPIAAPTQPTQPGRGKDAVIKESGGALPTSVTSPDGKVTVRLFGTVDFRSPLKNTPKWERVVKAMQGKTIDNAIKNSGRANAIERWDSIKNQFGAESGANIKDKMTAVNIFINQWPYRTDNEIYGLEDYWATPDEFLRKSGDCEDYAITKYYAMLQLGVPENTMRVVALKDTIRGLAHAILIVYANDDAYVMDNLTNTVNSHARIKNYLPFYSLSPVYRWAHVVPKK